MIDAAAELAAWHAPASQAALREDFLASATLLRKADRPDHLTASAAVLDPSRSQVLLILHRKVGRWLQPGGHLEEADASLGAGALREAREETGLQDLVLGPLIHLDRHPAPCGARWHLDVRFLVTAPAAALPVLDAAALAEVDGARWFPVDDLPNEADLGPLVRAALSA